MNTMRTAGLALGSFLFVLLLASLGQLERHASGEGKAPPIRFGIAETDVTPALGGKPVYLAGFGHNRRATKVHDPIMARAVVLADGEKKLALVTVDVVGFFFPEVQEVRKQLADFHYVLVSSTHNHEGPDTLGLWGPTPVQSGVDPAYLTLLRAKIVETVRAAETKAQPASVTLGRVKAPELLHDGREPYVLHDELAVLRFAHSTTQRPLGLLVHWHCHPETMDDKNTELTADYPFYTVKRLAEKHSCPVAYFTGTVGGLLTSLHTKIRSANGEELKDGTWEKTQRYGELLADRCDEALTKAVPVNLTPMEIRSRSIFIPMTNPLYHLGRKLGVLKRQACRDTGDLYRSAPITPQTPDREMTIETEVAALLLGDVRVACIPGEIYPELVLDRVQDPVDPGADYPDAPVEPSIFGSLGGKHQLLIGLANDEIGYILPKRQWDEKPPFCYKRKKDQYGEQNSVGPAAGPAICQAMKDLMGR